MITALVDLMGACYQAGNPNQMALVARSILASIPKDIVALHFLGLALYQMGHLEAARRAFSKACTPPAQRRKSDGATTGEEAATTMLREASAPAAGLSEAWQHIALAMRKLGFRNAAFRAYRTSLAARGLAGISMRGEKPVTSAVPTITTAAPASVYRPISRKYGR